MFAADWYRRCALTPRHRFVIQLVCFEAGKNVLPSFVGKGDLQFAGRVAKAVEYSRELISPEECWVEA